MKEGRKAPAPEHMASRAVYILRSFSADVRATVGLHSTCRHHCPGHCVSVLKVHHILCRQEGEQATASIESANKQPAPRREDTENFDVVVEAADEVADVRKDEKRSDSYRNTLAQTVAVRNRETGGSSLNSLRGAARATAESIGRTRHGGGVAGASGASTPRGGGPVAAGGANGADQAVFLDSAGVNSGRNPVDSNPRGAAAAGAGTGFQDNAAFAPNGVSPLSSCNIGGAASIISAGTASVRENGGVSPDAQQAAEGQAKHEKSSTAEDAEKLRAEMKREAVRQAALGGSHNASASSLSAPATTSANASGAHHVARSSAFDGGPGDAGTIANGAASASGAANANDTNDETAEATKSAFVVRATSESSEYANPDLRDNATSSSASQAADEAANGANSEPEASGDSASAKGAPARSVASDDWDAAMQLSVDGMVREELKWLKADGYLAGHATFHLVSVKLPLTH